MRTAGVNGSAGARMSMHHTGSVGVRDGTNLAVFGHINGFCGDIFALSIVLGSRVGFQTLDDPDLDLGS